MRDLVTVSFSVLTLAVVTRIKEHRSKSVSVWNPATAEATKLDPRGPSNFPGMFHLNLYVIMCEAAIILMSHMFNPNYRDTSWRSYWRNWTYFWPFKFGSNSKRPITLSTMQIVQINQRMKCHPKSIIPGHQTVLKAPKKRKQNISLSYCGPWTWRHLGVLQRHARKWKNSLPLPQGCLHHDFGRVFVPLYHRLRCQEYFFHCKRYVIVLKHSSLDGVHEAAVALALLSHTL